MPTKAEDLTLDGTPRVAVSGPHAGEFAVTLAPAASVPAGGATVFEVTFAPVAGGDRTAVLSLANNDADEDPYTFAIQGTGLLPGIEVLGNGIPIACGDRTPTYVDHTRFEGIMLTGTTERVFTIRNPGLTTLNLSGTPPVTVSGAHDADFVVSAPPVGSLGPGESSAFTVRFAPSGPGRREALVTIPSNVGYRDPYAFAIEGAGRQDCYFEASYPLSLLNGTNGFALHGIDAADSSGWSVSDAGDINGDGYADVIVGACEADGGGDADAGETYVVFGKAGGWSGALELAELDGTNGFRLEGIDVGDQLGFSVSGAGDINADGYGDLLVGAYLACPNGMMSAGETYVVFGKPGVWPAALALSALDGTNGFLLDGLAASDWLGCSVSGAGDVNGDGYADFLVGADGANSGSKADAGATYVVFGRAGGWPAALDLAALGGMNGFRVAGIDAYDGSGCAVSAAGDVNGDGYADIIIGAYYADPDGVFMAGESYVVFGRAGGWPVALDLADLGGTNGFRLDGSDASGYSGFSVSGAGDVNGDGCDDVIVGAYGAGNLAGRTYVVFGKATGWSAALGLSALNGTNGFQLDAAAPFDWSGYSVSGAGDVNGDGYDDVIIGAQYADAGSPVNAGASYVVFGKSGGWSSALNLSLLDGANGFRLVGVRMEDRTGSSVSGAGDVNGDGYDDVVFGATGADPGGRSGAGASYVFFGGGLPLPEMVVLGNSIIIADGDGTPSLADHTDFGTVAGPAVARTFIVTNTGRAALSLSGSPRVLIGGAHAGDFTLTSGPAATVPAGGATDFVVMFNPGGAGLRSATVSIANNDADENPYTFAIQGTGLGAEPEMDVLGNGISIANGDDTPCLPDCTDFGPALADGRTVARTFTVTNSGTAALSLTGSPRVAVSGAQAGEFTVTVQPAASIAAGGAAVFEVRFDPAATGIRGAQLSIANDDADENPYTFSIRGMGTTPPALEALQLGPGGDTFIIRWSSYADHLYTLRQSTNLLHGFFMLEDNIPATPPVNTYTDTVNGAESRFWKVETEE